MSGWNRHGHAVLAGRPADWWLGSGELQDAENCGYDPSPSTFAEMDVDESVGPALDQFRAGRIRLADGTVLVRGGTLGCVWAVQPPPLAILNTTVTEDGTYDLRTITLGQARWLVAEMPAIQQWGTRRPPPC